MTGEDDLKPRIEGLLLSLKNHMRSEVNRTLVAEITADLVAISGEAMAGRDVTEEMAQIKAQVANLTAEEVASVASNVSRWAARFVYGLMIQTLTHA